MVERYREQETLTHLPSFCDDCQRGIVRGAAFRESDSWQALIVLVQIGLFQAASRDRRVWERCAPLADGKRDPADLSLVLAEIGCLGCFKPKTCQSIVDAVKREGFSVVAQRIKAGPWEDIAG